MKEYTSRLRLPYNRTPILIAFIYLLVSLLWIGRTPEILRMGAPAFGQHTDEVLREYGYTPEDIARFTEQGVIA